MFAYINLYDSSNSNMDFKVKKSVFVPRWCGWQQYGEDPFFDKSFIFMEADLSNCVYRVLGIFRAPILMQFLQWNI